MAFQLQHGFDTEQPSGDALEVSLQHVKEFGLAVDGGAYLGGVAKILAQKFRGVYAFEPNIKCLPSLRENIKDRSLENVCVFDVGLGDKRETVEFTRLYTVGCHVDPGLQLQVFIPGSKESSRETLPFEIIKLDDLNLPRLDFLKLDLEGYETKAIIGAEETIKKFKPVIMVENIYKLIITSSTALAQWRQGEQTDIKMKSGYWRRYSEESPTAVLLRWGYRLIGKFDQLDDVLVYDGPEWGQKR